MQKKRFIEEMRRRALKNGIDPSLLDFSEVDWSLGYAEAKEDYLEKNPSLITENEWIREAIYRNRVMRDLKYGDLFKRWRKYRGQQVKQNPFEGWMPLKSVHQIR
jgi:hypothetical protein